MTKRIFPFLIVILFAIAACNQSTGDQAEAAKSDTTVLTVLTFSQLADSCIDKPVVIEGTVMHTCKHGGKRMFLIGSTDSIRVEITAGPNIVKFDENLIGSKVKVFGILKEERIDAKYLNEWEAEILMPTEGENHTVGIHTGAKGHEDEGKEDKLNQIKAYREDIKNSGTDHLSFFSIEATTYTEIK